MVGTETYLLSSIVDNGVQFGHNKAPRLWGPPLIMIIVICTVTHIQSTIN